MEVVISQTNQSRMLDTPGFIVMDDINVPRFESFDLRLRFQAQRFRFSSPWYCYFVMVVLDVALMVGGFNKLQMKSL